MGFTFLLSGVFLEHGARNVPEVVRPLLGTVAFHQRALCVLPQLPPPPPPSPILRGHPFSGLTELSLYSSLPSVDVPLIFHI